MYDLEHMDKRMIAYVNIFICANRLQAIMDNGFKEITTRQWLTLTMIDAFSDPPTLKQLSEICGVTHQSMRQIIDRLTDKGFVNVVPDQKDKRSIRILKTEKVQTIHTREAWQNIDFVYDVFSCLKEEETEVYCNALEKLCNKLKEFKNGDN